MALHIFPDRGLRQGIEAQSVALAIESYRREFLLTKHGDDPIQRNTAKAPINSGYMNLPGTIFVGNMDR